MSHPGETEGDVEMGVTLAGSAPQNQQPRGHHWHRTHRCSPTKELRTEGQDGDDLVFSMPGYPELPSRDNTDWQYVMRRTMQEIIPGLFLGPYAVATRAKLGELQAAGITHVICVRDILERNLVRPNHPDHFKYLVVEVKDAVMVNIIPHFKTVNEFVTQALDSGGKVLIHGNAGISRSAALIIAYIMEKYGVTTKEAFSYVQSKRFCCNPNEGFMAQLREYEPIYRANHEVPVPLPLNRPDLKRSRDSDPENGMDDEQA